MYKSQRQRRRGLTLLELMIVLIILVGLLALVGPRLLGSQRKADIKTTRAQIANIEQALKMYAVDMRSYPTTEDGLEALISAPEDERVARNWDGPYIDGNRLPLDPWGNEFAYENDHSGGNAIPRIYSFGPDSEEGTEDDIANRGKSEGGDAGDDGESSFDVDNGDDSNDADDLFN